MTKKTEKRNSGNRKTGKKRNRLLRLQVLNIFIFLFGWFIAQIIMFILGYSRFIFVSYFSIPQYEQGLYLNILSEIAPFVNIITVLVFILNTYLFIKILKRRYLLFNILNFIIVLLGLLRLITIFQSLITSAGVLG